MCLLLLTRHPCNAMINTLTLPMHAGFVSLCGRYCGIFSHCFSVF